MLTIDMTVKTEHLDATSIPAIAKMLLFPIPIDKVTFQKEEDGSLRLQFDFAMNGNTATSSVIFKHGTARAVAVLLDSIPTPIFLDGNAFLMTWEVGGFQVDFFDFGYGSTAISFENPEPKEEKKVKV